MRQIETKEIFYPLNWSLLCRPWKKGENPHQSPSSCKFSGLSDLTTSQPWLDLGGNEKWKGGRCSWQGGESRCALGRRGDHKYQQCLALSFARTRSTLLYILRIYSNCGYIPAIRPWFYFKWLYNRMNWCCCNDFWPIASIGRQTALCNSAELGSLWLQRLFKYKRSFIHCAKNCWMFGLQICADSVCAKTFLKIVAFLIDRINSTLVFRLLY